MIVWRLCRSIYADLSGYGGVRAQGRWNLAGHPVVYTSGSLSLSVLERRVHTKVRPQDEVAMQIEIPDSSIEILVDCSTGWQTNMGHTQSIGAEWLRSKRSLSLAVPSVLVPELNYLINPLHPDMDSVKICSINPYEYDSRLFE